MFKLIIVFLILMVTAPPIYAEMNVLPLGDSITLGAKTKSYRYYLWNLLKSNGYDINFVGSQKTQIFDNFDPDHEGHGGWRADQISASLNNWLKNYTPDIVLLHIGHNDFAYGESIVSTIDDIENIIDILRTKNPNVTILLAQIIHSEASYKYQAQSIRTLFNEQIVSFASSKTTPQSLVISVNQNEFFNPEIDTIDGVHPNDSGNEKMAQQWFKSIVPVLSQTSGSPAPPQGLRIVSASNG
jgi:lysophospholipase L1-like esterase